MIVKHIYFRLKPSNVKICVIELFKTNDINCCKTMLTVLLFIMKYSASECVYCLHLTLVYISVALSEINSQKKLNYIVGNFKYKYNRYVTIDNTAVQIYKYLLIPFKPYLHFAAVPRHIKNVLIVTRK